ncbi:hypothetical protein MTR_5g018810 [Medicago truncatula]|uniref:Uncharacterized protein n=1 Tax=Medicago truncatula TaxID=3880 RepID=G7KAR4_MEDTR|nr:hypothetical protein MTR_5g018810 [Medicago truncatula]
MKNNNNNEIKDSLSDLPNCLVLHILSFLDTKVNIWKHLPNLTLLYSSQFNTLESFTTFVSNILSLRDSSTIFVLSLVPNLLMAELPSLCNLKSLRVYVDSCLSIPDGIVDFLLRKSPSAKVDIIDWSSKGTVEGTKARGISDMFCQELGIKRVLKHDDL